MPTEIAVRRGRGGKACRQVVVTVVALSLSLLVSEKLLAQDVPTVVTGSQARIAQQGNVRQDGSFSLWTRGVIGDWFVSPQGGQGELRVTAWGRTVAGEPPKLGVRFVLPDGRLLDAGELPITSSQYQEFTLPVQLPRGFFGLRMRHLNREVKGAPKELRHLVVKSFGFSGAE
ncbi:MAG: hypothetical protein J7M26_00345, partial [Armatimonadetes bacterium]|nr:hypothetical protein [Armatimonadota bacterium]